MGGEEVFVLVRCYSESAFVMFLTTWLNQDSKKILHTVGYFV